MTSNGGRLPSSFRDPSGFLFVQDGQLYRQVNKTYRTHYDHLISSGLYENLVECGLLIPHSEASPACAAGDEVYKVLRPEMVPFVSYPYEWCFSQLKDAALTTLAIQKQALDHGMALKDSSAYNIQFMAGKPVLIDTLSFEKYREGEPWVAYRQFCQHFLAPLALMSYTDIRLSQLLRVYLDGIPLDLACSLLPFRTRLSLVLFSHLHLHARSQRQYADKAVDTSGRGVSRLGMLGIIDSLDGAVRKLTWQPRGTQWADYYADTNYSTRALDHKQQIIAQFLDRIQPRVVWDLGANTGRFSRIAGSSGIQTVAFDMDPAAVESNYRECRAKGEENLLPLVLDLTNPSPGVGWENEERMSLLQRGPAETVLALALVHHLAISNNLPLDRIAAFLRNICDSLIIEFVPKSDSQVQRLLATREDIFAGYRQEAFECEFSTYFAVRDCVKIQDSERTLYWMQGRQREA